VLNFFAQVDAPQSCFQIYVPFKKFLFQWLLKIVMYSIVKVTEYPSLHSCPTESSELFSMDGN
jgi:hypothetical protein